MKPVDELLSRAAKLPAPELAEFSRSIQALASFTRKNGDAFSSSPNIHLLYGAVCFHLHHHYHIHPAPVDQFLAHNTLAPMVWEALKKAEEQVVELLPNITRTEWASVADLIAGLAVHSVKGGEFKSPWVGVAWALKNVPFLLDTHFPGYASSGLLKVVLRQRIQKQDLRIKLPRRI